MQRKIILSLVVIGILFGITCTAGCVTEADPHSPNDIVGKWRHLHGKIIEIKESDIVIMDGGRIDPHDKSLWGKWNYLGYGMYYYWIGSTDFGTYLLKDDVLYGGMSRVWHKEEGPKNSIVGRWYFPGDDGYITINDDLLMTDGYESIQLIGSGENGELHHIQGSQDGGLIASSEYMIGIHSTDIIFFERIE